MPSMIHHDDDNMPNIHPKTKTNILDNIHDVKFTENSSLKIVYLNARSLNNKEEEIDRLSDI